MNGATLGIASDFVKSGIAKAGIPLTENLEAYLSITFARFIGAEIQVDLLTVRIAKAMDENAPRDAIRNLADECLIATAFFEGRLRRNGAIRHYVALGQMTYDAANLVEQAYGFMHMRDVIASAAKKPEESDACVLFDQVRAGSSTARSELAARNIVIGPWTKPDKPGFRWS